MRNPAFEKIVASDHYLNMLINEQTYGIKASITKTPAMTADFIDWVSPKYYDSFKNIYDRNKDKNPRTVAAVVKVCFLGKPEVHEELASLFMTQIEEAVEASSKLHKSISILKDVAVEEFPKFTSSVDDLSFTAITSINTVEVKEKRQQFAENLLSIIEIMGVPSKSRFPKEFKVYEGLADILQRMNLDGKQKIQAINHSNKASAKNISYAVGIILFILFILIRWAIRFSR